jgi:pimeloyl-ACP methyl ester carboxylesterase
VLAVCLASLRCDCGKGVANSEHMSWIFWSALLFVLAIATLVYSMYRREVAAARARTLSESRILETRCGRIEYSSLGEGSPVLVLHGTGGGWDQGLASARGLAAHGFQLIAPSRFGYLRTPLPADPTPEAEADTWAGFLDALQIQRLPVIAFSAGAAPAAQLALRHPDRVSALVLVVPGAGGLCAEPAIAPPRALLDAVFRFDFPMWAIIRLAPRIVHRLVAVPSSLVPSLRAEDKARLVDAVRMILPASSRRLGVLNEGNAQGSARQYPLERISAPTLLISAADDLYKTLPNARHAARLIPHARLIEFATGGHLLLAHENEVWREVAGFLEHAAKERYTAA